MSINEKEYEFIKQESINIVSVIAPKELPIIHNLFHVMLVQASDRNDSAFNDEASFGDNMATLSPIVVEIVRDIAKDMMVAGITLSAKEFYAFAKKEISNYYNQKKIDGNKKKIIDHINKK